MKKNKKVVKYKKPFNINIGVIIFIIIFIYLLFNVFSYMTTTHISVYEVQQGTMAENNVYRGLILRNERVYYADYTGSLNFYVKEASKVSYNSLVYSIDQNGDISQLIREANQDGANLDADSLAEIEESITEFSNTYNGQAFYHVYSFKEDVDSTLNEALSLNALNDLSEYAQSSTNFHQVRSDSDGIVVFYTDGYENVTADDFTSAMFDESSYEKNSTKNNTSVNSGDPVYKLIDSEYYQIIIPISETLADELSNDDTMKIRFLKDEKTTYATYTLTRRGEENYLILALRNSMVRYAKDRYIEVELMLTEETGLKIPNSAITEKEFYTIPVEYFMKGGDTDSDGLLVERTGPDGKSATEFISPTVYFETDTFYYIDGEDVTAGERLVKPNSTETYTIGPDTDRLKGVYNINKGYAVFKQIDILYQNQEYAIVRTGTSYGISLYDHIALDGTKINENDLIK